MPWEWNADIAGVRSDVQHADHQTGHEKEIGEANRPELTRPEDLAQRKAGARRRRGEAVVGGRRFAVRAQSARVGRSNWAISTRMKATTAPMSAIVHRHP
jgi:SLT domain-containing protein